MRSNNILVFAYLLLPYMLHTTGQNSIGVSASLFVEVPPISQHQSPISIILDTALWSLHCCRFCLLLHSTLHEVLMFFCLGQYYNLQNISLTPLSLMRNNGTVDPMTMCWTHNNFVQFSNGSFVVGPGVVHSEQFCLFEIVCVGRGELDLGKVKNMQFYY